MKQLLQIPIDKFQLQIMYHLGPVSYLLKDHVNKNWSNYIIEKVDKKKNPCKINRFLTVFRT